MTNFTVCRVCLAVNLKVHSIANTQLQVIYENLTRTKLNTEDERPVTVCYICHSQLQRCGKLVELAQNSEKLLLQLYHSGIGLSRDAVLLLDRVSAHNYSVTPIESICLLDLSVSKIEVVLSKDLKHETTVVMKEESVECCVRNDVIENESDVPAGDVKMDTDHEIADHIPSSDSDDNVPLNAFKVAREIVKQVKIKRQKRGYRKDVKIDAHEVTLSKEQQIEVVMARAKSLNYLNSPFKCHLCYKGFVNEVTYSNHVEKHDESSGIYKCDVCALRYHSSRLLRTHAVTAHARYFKCNKCEHVSHTTNQARDHEKWHEGFTFECQLCGQKFKKRTSYLTHTRKNHPTESVCNLCGYSFVGKNGLLLHKSKTHKRDTEEENCSVSAADRFCASCSIQFVSLEAYHRHLLSSFRHKSNQSSTQCFICNQNHPDLGSLTEHMKVHKRKLLHPSPVVPLGSVQAQLPCDVCGATFSSRSRLAAHVNRKHLGLKYAKHVVCELCGVQFTSAASLRYHQRSHSGERPYPCDSCAKRFSDANQLRVHERTHTGERPYSCVTCHKRFSQKPALNRHYRVHTGVKPYVCQVCSKCFSQSNSLKSHVQTVHLKMPAHRKRKRTATAAKNDYQILINTE